jgi:hypothetical protein
VRTARSCWEIALAFPGATLQLFILNILGVFHLVRTPGSNDEILYFALSFLVQAGHRVYAAFPAENALEDEPLHYLIRLLAYALILWAVLEKNWPRRKHPD